MTKELPIPGFFDASTVSDLRIVRYETLKTVARDWAIQYGLKPVVNDKIRIAMTNIDGMLTFTHKDGGLPVEGAEAASVRTVEFIYKNLQWITSFFPTIDTHTVWQIFHESYLIDENGNHPSPGTQVLPSDIRSGRWKLNPAAVYNVLNSRDAGAYTYLNNYTQHYTDVLEAAKKYALTTWPYHGLLGGVEHALIPILHEAIFFHEIARSSQRRSIIKGGNPLTENYSPIQPDVKVDQNGKAIGQKNTAFLQALLEHDYIIASGFASSHCFKWFVDDLLEEIMAQDKKLVEKIYLMRDCCAPVVIRDATGNVIPGLDFTEQANEAFDRFAAAGMHVVNSTTPLADWPGIRLD